MVSLDDLNKKIYELLKLVDSEKYNEAQDLIKFILNNNDYFALINSNHWQYIGDVYLACGEFQLAKNAYIKANNALSEAFVSILTGDIESAKKLLMNAKPSPASNWCRFLISVFSGTNRFVSPPSFLTIRHFLEMTVYYLLLACNHKYLELLLKSLNKLMDVNLDSEKLVGYAYFHFGDLVKSSDFLYSALKKNDMDGEIYYMLGRLYVFKEEYGRALNMLEKARLLLDDHAPTKELIEIVKTKIKD